MNNVWFFLAVTITIFIEENAASVQIKPTGNGATNRLTYQEGNNWVITCSLVPRTATESRVEWLGPNNLPITNSVSRTIVNDVSSAKLSFNPIKKTDSGFYTCVERAPNGNRLSQQTVEIEVLDSVSLVHVVCNPVQYVLRGTTAYVRCSVSPSDAEVTWSLQSAADGESQYRRLGSRFISQANCTLEIRDVQFSDSGTYLVSAVSPETGAASEASFQVNVVEPPKIVAPLNISSGTPLENEDITIQCQVSGEPAPRISWYKGRELIVVGKRIGPLQNGRELLIRQLRPTDAGSYSCVASNMVGNDTSFFDLRVIVKPNIEWFASQTVRRDTILRPGTFLCRVVASEGVDVQIWKGDRMLPSGPEFPRVSIQRFQSTAPNELVSVSVSIYSDSVRPEDTAVYTCKASTAAGTAMLSANLTVLHKPEILNRDTERECVKKDEVPCILTCSVLKGAPQVAITWWKDNQQIVSGPYGSRSVTITDDNSDLRVKHSRLQLSVNIVQSADTFRAFRCNATNYYGVALHTYTVREVPRPGVLNVSLVYSTPTTIFYELYPPVNTNPQFPVTHYSVQQTLVSGTHSTKTYTVAIDKYFGFRNLIANQLYVFQITAVSDAGPGAPVSLSRPPVEPRKPYTGEVVSPGYSMNKTSYLARWRVPNDGGARITEYKLTYTAVESLNKQAQIGVSRTKSVQPTDYSSSIGASQFVITNSSKFFEEAFYEEAVLEDLADATTYQLLVVAVNSEGAGDASSILFGTYDDGTHAAALAAATRSSVAIGLLIALVLILILIDVGFHYYRQRGVTHWVIEHCKDPDDTSKSPPCDQYDFESTDQRYPMMGSQQTMSEKTPNLASNWSLRENGNRTDSYGNGNGNGTDHSSSTEKIDDGRMSLTKSLTKKDAKRTVEWLDERSGLPAEDEEQRRASDSSRRNQSDGSLAENHNNTQMIATPTYTPSRNRYEAVEEEDEAEPTIAASAPMSSSMSAPSSARESDATMRSPATTMQYGVPRGANNPNYSDASAPRSPGQSRNRASSRPVSAAAPAPAPALAPAPNGDLFPAPPTYLAQQYVPPAGYVMQHNLPAVSYPYGILPQANLMAKQRAAPVNNHLPVDVEMHRVPVHRAPMNGDEYVSDEVEPILQPEMQANGIKQNVVKNGVGKNVISQSPDSRSSLDRKQRQAASAYSPAHTSPPAPIALVPSAPVEPAVSFSLPPPSVGVIQEFSF